MRRPWNLGQSDALRNVMPWFRSRALAPAGGETMLVEVPVAESVRATSALREAPAPTQTPDEPPRRSRFARAKSLRTFEALGSRSFRWFFLSMMAQFSSMHMQMVVTPFLVFELTGSYAKLGAIALIQAVPGLLLGFVGGVVADRAPKKLVVQIGQTANALSTLAVALLLVVGQLSFGHLLLVSTIQGAVFGIMGPARQALIPEVVGPKRLTNAVALNMSGMNITRLGMPALAGLLIAWVGAAGVFFVMAGFMLLSMVGLAPVTKYVRQEGDPEPTPEPEGSHFSQRAAGGLGGGVRDVIDGMRYILKDRVIFTLLCVNFFIVLMSMPYMQMMAGFVKEVLGAGPGQLGLLWSITGVGALLGSLVVASMPSSGRGRAYLLSAGVLGIALMAFAWSTWFWATAAIMVLVGIGQAGRMSLSNVLLMSYTHPSYQGRVMSVFMMEFSLVSFGTFIVGVLASIWGIQIAIGGTALSLVVIAIVCMLFVPRVRDLP